MENLKKYLIINADDFNLSGGVSEGILECHERGVVTSASAFSNRDPERRISEKIKTLNTFSLGVHLNITFGRPLLSGKHVKTLTDSAGQFLRREALFERVAKPSEIKDEFRAQIERFEKIFSRRPSHLDTHHQVHDEADVAQILCELACEYQLPVRLQSRFSFLYPENIVTTDHLFDELDEEKKWNEERLQDCLKRLPAGTSELMCHPGFLDQELRRLSSLQDEREREVRLFCNPQLKRFIKDFNIQMINYYDLWEIKQSENISHQ